MGNKWLLRYSFSDRVLQGVKVINDWFIGLNCVCSYGDVMMCILCEHKIQDI